MGVVETRQGKMKASICLLLFMYVSYVLTAAAGGDDQGRKKRSADGYSNDYSTYYGAGPSTQYQTLGFGMAGQQPYYGKMKYTDPLFGERYKAWLAGQAMYGFRMKPTKPVLPRNHWYLRHLLKKGIIVMEVILDTVMVVDIMVADIMVTITMVALTMITVLAVTVMVGVIKVVVTAVVATAGRKDLCTIDLCTILV